MTSTLQQEAGRKLRFSADRTMRGAQRLYENGYITYLRTDSTTLSPSAIDAARTQARELYGDAYVPAQPRQYTRKVKNAQEAHEAIRPAGERFRTPGEVARELDGDDYRLYELIWQRTVASQMADARGTTVSVRIAGTAGTGEAVTFAASGRTITFPGFLKAYVETLDEGSEGEADDAESRLPELTQGQALIAESLTPEGHNTNPPSRYTEPSLVKSLEDLGHRAAVHVRVDHQDDPGPRVRVEEGCGARPVVGGVRGGGAVGAPLRTAGRLPLHGRHGGRARRHRLGQPAAHRLALGVLLRGRRRAARDRWRARAG